MVFILIGCFTGTVEASARASGRFDITVAAGELKPAKTGFPLGGRRNRYDQRIILSV